MAKAQETETASAATASEEKTTEAEKVQSGQAGMTIEERLAAGKTSSDAQGAIEDRPPVSEGESQGEDTDEGEGQDKDTEEGENADADDKADEEDGEIKDGEVEGLNPKAQAKINKRIHALNIKRKNAEAKTEQTESQLTDLGKKIQDASIQAAMKMGFDPNYISTEEAKTLNRVEQLRAWKKFLRANRGGYEGDGTKDFPSKTPEQVAEQEAEIEDELLDIGGPARAMALERMALKDADAAVGRKIRLDQQLLGGAGKSITGLPPKKVNPKPPRLPESNGATRRPPVSTASKVKPVFDKVEFNKAGGDKAALGKAYDKLYGAGS